MADQGPGRARARRRLPPRDPLASRSTSPSSTTTLGGEPHALVYPIEARTPAAPPRDRAASAASRPDGARACGTAGARLGSGGGGAIGGRGGAALEGGGAGFRHHPGAGRRPPAATGARRAARGRSRSGILPRIGADGSRPAQVYARPPDALLTSGARPAARIAVLVGGLGVSDSVTAEAIAKLPRPSPSAFSPYGGDAGKHVAGARDDGHEVMLQAPMEPFDYPDNDRPAHAHRRQGAGQYGAPALGDGPIRPAMSASSMPWAAR